MKLLLLLGIMFDPNIEMRQQTMRLLKEEGMGKDEMEVKVIAEAAKLCEYFIEPHLESEVDLGDSLYQVTSNVIFSVIVGQRFEYDTPQLLQANEMMKVLFESNMAAIISKNIPFSAYFPGDPFQHKINSNALKGTLEYFDNIVAERRQLLNNNRATGSFVDKFLQQFSNSGHLTQQELGT